jgi:hypothetical protein
VTVAFWFITTKTSYEVAVPVDARDQAEFNRRVAYALQEISGGITNAGELVLRASPNAVANHLLCDGQTLDTINFPQLADALGATGDTFTLPTQAEIWANSVTPPTPPTQVIEGGSVSSGTTTTTPDGAGQTGGSSGGGVNSGGRYRGENVREL